MINKLSPADHNARESRSVQTLPVDLCISVPTIIASPSPPPLSCCTQFADRGRFGRWIFSILSLIERGVLLACLCYGTVFLVWNLVKNWSFYVREEEEEFA